MGEYIVSVPDEAAEYFIARFGLDGTKMMGYDLTDEIVRCRDCKHTIHFWHHDDERWQCMNEMLEGLDVSSDFFCAWGERKEGGDD